MSYIWQLQRELFMRKNLYRPIDLQTLLEANGLPLSLPAVCAFFNETPSALRLRTMQAICNSLNCRLSDFFIMEPDTDERKGSTSNGEQGGDSGNSEEFPDPFQFPMHEDD
jgi:DNA-binding Xre family transcriptional regulator